MLELRNTTALTSPKLGYGKTIDSNNIHNIKATTFPHALKMANRASSDEVPSNILERANDIWRRQHPTENFGLSYKSPDPSTYYTQQFGRDICFATGSAGLEAISLLGDGPLIKSSRNNTCYNDALNLFTNCTDTNAFRRINEGNAESSQPTMLTHVSTYAHSPENLTPSGFCDRHTYTKFTSPFTDLAVFGDSFSDVGNIYNVSNDTQPGVWSYNGRYSDGRVWEEYLLQFFDLPDRMTPSTEGGLNHDHAFGGATADNSYIDAFSTYLNDSVPSVKDQVTEYIDNQKGDLSPDRLHVIYVGYNDYWCIVQQVDTLYQKGARQFLIGNVPNMSSWAEASLQPQDVLDSYDVLVRGHNEVLSRLVAGFESSHDDTIIYEQDNFGAFECLDSNKDFVGINNIKDPCHPTQDDSCESIFSYKFWDYYHPTTHAHHVASTFAIQSIHDKVMERKTTSKRYIKTSLRKRH
ncbi:SGNH/GDSL hydrolase family protein [Skeletonema marinoi]|uniref:SGNH/GDSL hydrolase family protein n=1 Tax=Skeletonema marinoi TaxID=267567 RepID=A0AAD8XU82_9STRA|nr:SGNH/GDSL hydrolase family protein [Skeletonema marinoi]